MHTGVGIRNEAPEHAILHKLTVGISFLIFCLPLTCHLYSVTFQFGRAEKDALLFLWMTVIVGNNIEDSRLHFG